MIEQALYARLVAVTGWPRVYPGKLPQNPTFPALTYQRASGARVSSIYGPSGLANPRFQIDVWAQTFTSMVDVAALVREGLDGFRGVVSGVRIGSIVCVGDFDNYEPGVELHRRTIDFSIWHHE